jgi:cytidylate kinase
MCIVTISKQSYTPAKEVAEKVAEELGFACISREILIEASEEFNVPEIKLLRAVRDAPSVLERFTFGKERYTAYIQAALLERLQRDKVVYHGLAGHHFVRGISHALRVRIIGEKEGRVRVVMGRPEVFEQAASAMMGISKEGLSYPGKHPELSRKQAMRILEDSDEARKRWSLHLYGIDADDPSLYDLVINFGGLSPDDAVDMICRTARLSRFQATAKSQRAMDDLFLAAQVKAKLVKRFPRASVTATKGIVYIGLEGGSSGDQKAIRDAVEGMPGVEKIDINVYPMMTAD